MGCARTLKVETNRKSSTSKTRKTSTVASVRGLRKECIGELKLEKIHLEEAHEL